MVPELLKTNPVWFILMTCSLPRYTSRLEIPHTGLPQFTCVCVLRVITVAFVPLLVPLNVCILGVPLTMLTVSLNCSGSPVGVIANEHSILLFR